MNHKVDHGRSFQRSHLDDVKCFVRCGSELMCVWCCEKEDIVLFCHRLDNRDCSRMDLRKYGHHPVRNQLTNWNWVEGKNISLLQKYWKNIKKCDWIAIKFQLLNFYRTDSNAIFRVMIGSLFSIIKSKSISYLSEKSRRKKLLKKI